MPFPLGQLALVVQLRVRSVDLVPETVLFVTEGGEPEALGVVARLGVDAFHVPQEEFFQHLLIELLRVLVDTFASHGENGARLEANRLGWSVAAKVIEELFEVLCRGLEGPLAFKHALWR